MYTSTATMVHDIFKELGIDSPPDDVAAPVMSKRTKDWMEGLNKPSHPSAELSKPETSRKRRFG